MTLCHAVILAAGCGTRLRQVVDDRPKGLIEIDGESLVGRSVRLLRDAGIEQITIVAGYLSDHYRRFAIGRPGVRIALNEAFETTGSMASLAVGLECVQGDLLVLESDILYETRALTAILAAAPVDSTLVSGVTGAGDEVWVDAPGGTLRAMSKVRSDLPGSIGEFVGITRLTASTAVAMRKVFRKFVEAHGHGRMEYETGGLVAVARDVAIQTIVVPDLCWGEIDDERQYARVVGSVWPVVRARPPEGPYTRKT
jgi:choline kinase